ncbi:MAG TPA: hypothetical protein VLA00_17980 [Xanthobacteraceae bacterium]|nr:hypothetical protein [Xanthobacteraceae bacterium]
MRAADAGGAEARLRRRPAAAAGRVPWRTALLVLAALWLAYRIAVGAVADHFAATNPELALSFVADQPLALVALAETRRTEGGAADVAAARAMAERALLADPLSMQALRTLALIDSLTGETDRANALMEAAGSRTGRDRLVQTWLLRRAAAEGDLSRMLTEADKLLRVRLEQRAELAPFLIQAMMEPEARPAVVAMLATAPPWRAWMVQRFVRDAPDVRPLKPILLDLKATAAPPTAAEMEGLQNRLINDGAIAEAYIAWIQLTFPRERISSLNNGDFRDPISGSPFDWRIVQPNGAQISVRRAEGASGQALAVDFLGGRTRFSNVRQIMALPPGKYTFSGRVSAESLVTPRGMQWRLYCLPGMTVIAETERVRASSPWKPFDVPFDVSPDCSGQVLRLELSARVPSEENITGRILYTDLQVNRSADVP